LCDGQRIRILRVLIHHLSLLQGAQLHGTHFELAARRVRRRGQPTAKPPHARPPPARLPLISKRAKFQ
jgi:hypothetical protein